MKAWVYSSAPEPAVQMTRSRVRPVEMLLSAGLEVPPELPATASREDDEGVEELRS
jgi:hypothetical protein